MFGHWSSGRFRARNLPRVPSRGSKKGTGSHNVPKRRVPPRQKTWNYDRGFRNSVSERMWEQRLRKDVGTASQEASQEPFFFLLPPSACFLLPNALLPAFFCLLPPFFFFFFFFLLFLPFASFLFLLFLLPPSAPLHGAKNIFVPQSTLLPASSSFCLLSSSSFCPPTSRALVQAERKKKHKSLFPAFFRAFLPTFSSRPLSGKFHTRGGRCFWAPKNDTPQKNLWEHWRVQSDHGKGSHKQP